MAKLIEASGLLEQVVRIQASEQAPEKKVGQIIMAITDAPVVDAVEVVRCKDCEKWHTPDCIMSDGLMEAEDNDFCSYGERSHRRSDDR